MARYTERQKAALDALMKDDVFEKAISIMTGEDIHALTMERLANDVGVCRGTLYNYFADRYAVVDFVIERTFEPLKIAIDQLADSSLTPEEQLTKIVEWVFSTIYEDRALVVALVPTKHEGGRREKNRARFGGFVSAIEAIVRKGIARGTLRNLDPVLVSEIFFGAIRGMVDSMAECGEFLPPEEVVPVFNGVLLGGLRQPDHDTTVGF